jgi:hypothetical protein
VFASASRIHLAPEELAALSGRMADVLRGGGKLLALVQNGEGIREKEVEADGTKWR